MTRELNFSGPPAGTTMMSSAVLLRRAVNQLAGGGAQKWIKGDFHDFDGGSCALGAIHLAMKGYGVNIMEYRKAERLLIQTLKDMHPELSANNISDLNDDPAVTFEDIVAAFEKTAMILEEKPFE